MHAEGVAENYTSMATVYEVADVLRLPFRLGLFFLPEDLQNVMVVNFLEKLFFRSPFQFC